MHPWLDGAPAVVFDFYGTLIDDDVDVPAMWRHLESLGFVRHADLEAAFEPNAHDGSTTPSGAAHDEWLAESWRNFLRLSGVEEGAMLASLTRTRESFKVQRAAGVDELLTGLSHHGVARAICSNWESPIAPYLELAGLDGFDVVVTSRDVGARKPGNDGLIWRRCDGLIWPHLPSDRDSTVRVLANTDRRSQKGWVPEWSCSRGFVGIESSRSCRCMRWRAGMGCIGGRSVKRSGRRCRLSASGPRVARRRRWARIAT